VQNVLEFLTAKEIARVGSVCSQLRQSCSDQQLWARLYRDDFLRGEAEVGGLVSLDRARDAAAVVPGAGGSPRASSRRADDSPSTPREAYRSKYLQRRERVAAARRAQQAQLRMNSTKQRRLSLRMFLTRAQSALQFLVPTLCGFTLLGLTAANLDAHFPPDTSQRPPVTSWWTLVAIAVVANLSMLAALLMNAALFAWGQTTRQESLCVGQWAVDQSLWPCAFVVEYLYQRTDDDSPRKRCCSRVRHTSSVIFIALVAISPPLVLASVASYVDGGPPWFRAAVAPLCATILLAPFVRYMGVHNDNRDLGIFIVTCGIFILLSIPVVITIVFAASRADRVIDWSVGVILLPLWIMDGIYVLATVILTTAAAIIDGRSGGCTLRSVGIPILIGLAFLGGFGFTLLCFELLLTGHMDGWYVTSWGTVFSPLLVLLAPLLLFLLGSGLGSCIWAPHTERMNNFRSANRITEFVS
jgi:hypothetical protein